MRLIRCRFLAMAAFAIVWLAGPCIPFAHAGGPPASRVRVKLSSKAWKAVPLPAMVLDVAEHDGMLWACGADEMLARSHDRGRTWTVVQDNKGGQLLSAVAFSGTYGWALGSRSTEYRTTDDGAHWSRMSGPGGSVIRVLAADSSHVIAQTRHRVLISSDGGMHWSSQSVSSPKPGRGLDRVKAIAILDGQHAGALMEIPGLNPATAWHRQVFLSTVDGGRRWKGIGLPEGMVLDSLRSNRHGYMAFGIADVKHVIGDVVAGSPDGVQWSISPAKEGAWRNCGDQGCITSGNSGWVDLQGARPVNWAVKPLPKPAGAWAAAGNVMCVVSTKLECIEAMATATTALKPKSARIVFPSIIHVAPNLQAALCIRCPLPKYPGAERSNKVQGKVIMRVLVGRDGRIRSLTLVSAPSAGLAQAAMKAVRGWQYRPATLGSETVEVDTRVIVNFNLAR